MIKADRLGVVSYWSEIVRAGRRIIKIRPVATRQPHNEYWGFTADGGRTQKLGHAQKFGRQLGSLRQESGTLNASRWMKGGMEFREFTDARQAEDWIAESDRWGALQGR